MSAMTLERRPMDRSHKRKVVAGTVAAIAVGGAGAGIAATQLRSSPGEESKAVISDAAMKPDLKHKLDRAVSDGRTTKAEEDQDLEDAESRITNLVNGKIIRPARPERWFGRPDRDHAFPEPPAA